MPAPETVLPSQETANARNEWRCAALCALIVVLAVALADPRLETGLYDDWAYARTVQVLAATGHLRYFGASNPLLGVQAFWGALWVWLFGFSFTALRLATLPFAAGCGLLLYALGRRAGLVPVLSTFGALVIVLCPVFVPLAASFMTDVYGFFFLLACIYGCVRAVADAEAISFGERAAWLTFGAAMGFLGGSARQAVWLAPLVLLPWCALVALFSRRDGDSRANGARLAAAAGVLWAVVAGAVFACLRWYAAQPYSLPDSPLAGLADVVRRAPFLPADLFAFVLTALLLSLPVFAATVRSWGEAGRRAGVIVWAVALLVCLGGPFVRFGDRAFAPWARNFVTRWGISLPNETLIGARAQTLPFAAWAVLSVAVYALLATLLITAGIALWERRGKVKGPHRAPTLTVCSAFVLFAAVYLPPLAPRAAQGNVFDRYLLLVLPAVTMPVLLFHQKRSGPTLPRGAWGILAVFGAYSVAATHDYLAMSRARLQAASVLIAAGVPRTQIVAGVEFDGWTQIEANGYVNDPRIVVPPGAYHPPAAEGTGRADLFWFMPWTPAITPRYVVALSPSQSLLPSPFAPVRYARWLALGGNGPPAEVVTQRVPDTGPQ